MSKYTQREKKQLSNLYSCGINYKQVKEISKRIMQKIYSHDDTSNSTREFVTKHPEYKFLPWEGKRKMLKKRFSYLTFEEIDFLGKMNKEI